MYIRNRVFAWSKLETTIASQKDTKREILSNNYDKTIRWSFYKSFICFDSIFCGLIIGSHSIFFTVLRRQIQPSQPLSEKALQRPQSMIETSRISKWRGLVLRHLRVRWITISLPSRITRSGVSWSEGSTAISLVKSISSRIYALTRQKKIH